MSPFWSSTLIILTLVPVVALAAYSVFDTLRRSDLSGVVKTLWIAAAVLLPLIGAVLYLVFRPSKPGDIRGFGRRRPRSRRFQELVPPSQDEDREP